MLRVSWCCIRDNSLLSSAIHHVPFIDIIAYLYLENIVFEIECQMCDHYWWNKIVVCLNSIINAYTPTPSTETNAFIAQYVQLPVFRIRLPFACISILNVSYGSLIVLELKTHSCTKKIRASDPRSAKTLQCGGPDSKPHRVSDSRMISYPRRIAYFLAHDKHSLVLTWLHLKLGTYHMTKMLF